MAVASEKAETEKISAVLHESGITAQTLAGNQHEMAIGAADAHHAVTTQILDHAHEAAMGVQQAAQEQQAREHASQVAVTPAQQIPLPKS